MNRQHLEMLAEAIAHVSGYNEPGGPLFLARNPGGLKPILPDHRRDQFGNRIFNSVLDGLQALIYDVRFKVDNRMGPSATIQDLAAAYDRSPAVKAWVRFLRAAINDGTINASTLLREILGEK